MTISPKEPDAPATPKRLDAIDRATGGTESSAREAATSAKLRKSWLFSRVARNLDEDSWPLIKRLLRESFPKYANKYVFSFLLMAIAAATTAISAWIMQDVVNSVVVDRDLAKTRLIAFVVMGIFLVKGLASFGQAVILSRVGNAIVAEQQRRMYDAVLAHGMEFFAHNPSSLLMTQMTHNAQAARHVLNLLVTSIGRDFLTLIGLIAVMVWMQPVMSLVAVIIAPIAIFGVVSLVRRVRKIAKAEFVSLTRITMAMQETVLGIRVVKAFNLEDRMRQRMHAAIADVEDRANKIAHITARTSPLMETLGGFAIGGVILSSSWMIIEGGQTPGAFMSFLTALLLAYDPAKRLARLQVNMESGLIGVRLMFQLIDRPIALKEVDAPAILDVSDGVVRFNDVTFSYAEDQPVLTNLELAVPGGTSCALVGPSGGGKSTIMSLMLRLFDPVSGTITIDGQSIGETDFQSLRQAISFVSQDTFLFSGTVRENILVGRSDATTDEIIAAARAANAHDFISEMAEGYDTDVGENGAQLSGGQKQRVAIARAILKDAPIVLLDEATSALDSESEASVKTALDRLLKNRTSIIIAHRLSTIRTADKICVVNSGRIVEEGTHDVLLNGDTLYSKLHSLQFSTSPSNSLSD